MSLEKFNSGNTEGKETKAELRSVQYNSALPIEFTKTELKYEWSVDKRTGEIKELEQKIESKDTFEIKAKYNREKNETKIEVKLQNQQEQEQTLPGLVVVKLITKSGVLSFEY